MKKIDGKEVAKSIYSDIEKDIKGFSRKPCLIAILTTENPASLSYVNRKAKMCEKWFLQYKEAEYLSGVLWLQRHPLLHPH